MAAAGGGGKGGFRRGSPWLPLLVALLLGAELVQVEDILSQVSFVQRTLSSEEGPGEFMFEFDGDEVFYVDLDQKQVIWRLPEFQDVTTFQAENAESNVAALRYNMGVLMKRSNYTPAENVPPKVTVYPEKPVELGDPNILICLVNAFSPPVVNITWLKNGQEVMGSAAETDFYPNKDNTFHKFSYLTFIPGADDIYFCRVEHWSLEQPLVKEWNPNTPEPLPETAEDLVCGLGLAVGIVGIIMGIVLIIKSRQKKETSCRRDRL
ncbi:H-2 class II histocompatibility antigen, A-U alpha chain-like [Hemicordylus capensis]|uniref:H-2 class II histocompatibility antigen, A-U alpha chain-like n=1 Tax=Hemicordylus capensis TaxID=884348 RepID=UPI0023033BF2|nr:H-2 class II histocompatibility antigen, A-U alpha chain-like [Hemicordylus capensis]